MKNSRFIAKTWDLFKFKYNGGVYIIRPSSLAFSGGMDITVVSSIKEFTDAKIGYNNLVNEYKRKSHKRISDVEVIISEYFTNPLLFEGRKFHLRLYLLIVPQVGNVPFKCKIARNFGKILTAAAPYINGDYANKNIHDTHFNSTPRDIVFPDEFSNQEMLPYINEQLNHLEQEISVFARNLTYYKSQDKSGYEIFGIDVMVLSTGEIKLLEINDRVGYSNRDQTAPQTIQLMRRYADWEFNEAVYPLLIETSS
jgi:hypothetical protein